jgi:sortase A
MKRNDQFPDQTAIGLNAAGAQGKGRWKLMRLIEIALLALGSLLAGFFVAARLDRVVVSQQALKSFAAALPIPAPPAAAGSPETDSPAPDFSVWDQQRVRAYERAAGNRTGAPIAVLEIPKIGLTAPVLEGTDGLTLNHAVGRIAGTAWPGERGNIGLAAHRDGFFRGLKDIKIGDAIELRTRYGKDIYTVDHFQIVSPRDVNVLRPQPEPSLTLVTCYPFYYIGSAPKRFVVTAYLTQHTTAGPTASESRLISQTSTTTQEEL